MTNEYVGPYEKTKIAELEKRELDHTHEVLASVARSTGTKLAVAKSKPISSQCDTTYKAVHVSGTRPLNVIKWVVMHSTEGGTARSVAEYFTEESSGGSTQLIVDDIECMRTLSDAQIPWGAPGANYAGFHIEQCGYAKWVTTMWSTTHRKTLMRAAYKAALHCKRYGIPVRFVVAADLNKGLAGITTHNECTKAFGGTHTDPGTGWPRTLFMTMVKGYYVLIKAKVIA